MSRFVSVVYCDDIRNELGNKQSLMGIYRAALYVPEYPTILPKLCIVITIQTDKYKPFQSLTFRILKNDEPMIEVPLPAEALAPQEQVINADDGKEGYLFCGVVSVISPLQIDGPMKIGVRAIADGEELKGPALTIQKAPA